MTFDVIDAVIWSMSYVPLLVVFGIFTIGTFVSFSIVFEREEERRRRRDTRSIDEINEKVELPSELVKFLVQRARLGDPDSEPPSVYMATVDAEFEREMRKRGGPWIKLADDARKRRETQ